MLRMLGAGINSMLEEVCASKGMDYAEFAKGLKEKVRSFLALLQAVPWTTLLLSPRMLACALSADDATSVQVDALS